MQLLEAEAEKQEQYKEYLTRDEFLVLKNLSWTEAHFQIQLF